MDWNPNSFEFIKRFPNNYPIVYNDIQYTIKPSIHGIGLFANQDIPANTALGYLVPLSSNMYPFYLKNNCEYTNSQIMSSLVSYRELSNEVNHHVVSQSWWRQFKIYVIMNFLFYVHQTINV